jgi:trk system potassium uptake protein TrkH
LGLIQVGGLGIMTFTSLSTYLWRRRTTITDRITVGQNLLHDPKLNLGKFLVEMVSWTLIVESIGAALMILMAPDHFSLFSAIFHSVSAFCNAGFSLFADSLVDLKGYWGVNLIFVVLIFLGGIGFSVFMEFKNAFFRILKPGSYHSSCRVSWPAKVIFKTSLFLIVLGWAAIYFAEFVGYDRMMITDDAILTALFQSVTARTAGFYTLDIGQLTNVSLIILLFLMFVGGAPGSCAGGIKVTTFRILVAQIWSQLKGKSQVAVGRFAANQDSVKKALILFVFAALIIFTAVLLLDFTEGGDKPHYQVRGQFLEILFESVSAFSTVGLSTGLTAKLSTAGKWVIICLMFIGRIGPFVLISALTTVQKIQMYRLPEEKLMIG